MGSRRAVLPLLGFVVMLGAGAFVLRSCTATEQPSAYYIRYIDADTAGAIGPRGWIPSWIPVDAYDIYDQHAIDSQLRCIRFSVPTDRLGAIRQVLKPLDEGEVRSLDARCWFGPDWWFDGLIQQQPANDNALNAELYRGLDEGGSPLYVAIERGSNRVFIWSR